MGGFSCFLLGVGTDGVLVIVGYGKINEINFIMSFVGFFQSNLLINRQLRMNPFIYENEGIDCNCFNTSTTAESSGLKPSRNTMFVDTAQVFQRITKSTESKVQKQEGSKVRTSLKRNKPKTPNQSRVHQQASSNALLVPSLHNGKEEHKLHSGALKPGKIGDFNEIIVSNAGTNINKIGFPANFQSEKRVDGIEKETFKFIERNERPADRIGSARNQVVKQRTEEFKVDFGKIEQRNTIRQQFGHLQGQHRIAEHNHQLSEKKVNIVYHNPATHQPPTAARQMAPQYNSPLPHSIPQHHRQHLPPTQTVHFYPLNLAPNSSLSQPYHSLPAESDLRENPRSSREGKLSLRSSQKNDQNCSSNSATPRHEQVRMVLKQIESIADENELQDFDDQASEVIGRGWGKNESFRADQEAGSFIQYNKDDRMITETHVTGSSNVKNSWMVYSGFGATSNHMQR